MKYCTKCGKELFDEAVICPGCGCSTEAFQSKTATSEMNLVTKLSERIKINAIIWIVVAVLQFLIGLSGFWFSLIVGILNIISAVKDLNYCNYILENPNGIVSNFESLTSPIIVLLYNLLIGGLIGIVGSLYYFFALRGFVMDNRNDFLALEKP